MSNRQVISSMILTRSSETAVIHVPIEMVNIADWLLNLPDAEYQRCARPEHMAAGYTTTDDGRPMSINVEEIGGSLIVQHYVAEVHEPQHCHMVSLSDVRTPVGWTTTQVIWDLSVKPIDAETCLFTNTVISHPTREFLHLLAMGGQSFEEAAAERDAAVRDHNRHEAPNYAASIERRALASNTL
jgi:hypothetical protein